MTMCYRRLLEWNRRSCRRFRAFSPREIREILTNRKTGAAGSLPDQGREVSAAVAGKGIVELVLVLHSAGMQKRTQRFQRFHDDRIRPRLDEIVHHAVSVIFESVAAG